MVIKLRGKWRLWLISIVLLALGLRLIGIGSFMTVDEEKWMLRSGEFYHKLFDKADPGGTFTTTHPGATVQWLAGAGIYLREKQLGYNIDTSNLAQFRLFSTVPIALGISLLIGLVVWLVEKLMGYKVAFWSGLLLATEPYLIGMSQVVHVDMLLALFMLAGLLSWLVYRYDGRNRWLVLTGVMGGLALGTKLMPAVWLLVFVVLTAGWEMRRGGYGRQIRSWGLVIGIAAIVFYIVWPALWVKTNLADYYRRDIVHVTSVEHVALELAVEEPIAPTSFYARTVLGRISPFVLILTLGVIIVAIKQPLDNIVFSHLAGKLERHGGVRDKRMHVALRDVWKLVLYALGFLLILTIMAKKADRYALPALVIWPVLAGAGWVVGLEVVKSRMKIGWVGWGQGLVLLALILQPVAWMPYTIAYDNPWWDVRPLSQQGWGEGLDKVARWLNKQPLVDRMKIASWYPGVMRTYFKGETMSLSSRGDDRVGYIVTYRNMMGRAEDDVATGILDEWAGEKPVYTALIGGKEYAWVYRRIGLHYFAKNVGELVGKMEVGQIVAADDGWSGVEVGMSNFSSRDNTEEVVLHVKRSPDSKEDIRTVRVRASEIIDGEWQRFNFEPILNTKGKEYYIALTSENSYVGNAVTVRFVDRDVLPGEMVWRRRAIAKGEQNSKFIRPEFDIAYRLIYKQ